MSGLDYICEACRAPVHRAKGDEGRGRFCSVKCARAAQPRPTREARYWAKVRKGDGCWEWTAHRNASGYGLFYSGPRVAVRAELAHRVSWELHFGPIPAGLFVCHHCDNPPCVRPDHLFVGTGAANMRDRDRKGRHVALRGESIGNARLTEEAVRAMRARRAEGGKLRELAAEFGVSKGTVSEVCRGLRWAHVKEA